MRLLEGIADEAIEGASKSELGNLIAGLKQRQFVMRPAKGGPPVLFRTRFCMSYLAGPLTRDQIRRLVEEQRSAGTYDEDIVSSPGAMHGYDSYGGATTSQVTPSVIRPRVPSPGGVSATDAMAGVAPMHQDPDVGSDPVMLTGLEEGDAKAVSYTHLAAGEPIRCHPDLEELDRTDLIARLNKA